MRGIWIACCSTVLLGACSNSDLAPPYPAHEAEPEPGASWRTRSYTDRMTDITKRFVNLDGQMGRLYMSIDCPTEMYQRVTMFTRESGEVFYSTSDDIVYVSTRFDKEPAVGMERWEVGRSSATLPLERTQQFLESLLEHKVLLVTVHQTVGPSFEDTFDISEAKAGLDRLARECAEE